MKKFQTMTAKMLPRLMLFLIPSFSFSQSNISHGINWVTGLTWEQIKEKAKAENKYIFIDAYTTWCGPCKMMEKNVYPNDTVGDFFNEHFIAIKAQMDVTDSDSKSIKDWYNDATTVKTKYAVESYPSLIFLSPEGKILQKEEGYKPVQQFVSIAKETLIPGKVYDDPYKDYKALVNEYSRGSKRYDRMPYMIKTARKLNDSILVRRLFKEHLDYELTLGKNERYTKENIELWGSFTYKLDSKVLQFFLKDDGKIDEVMNLKGYSREVVDKTIQARIVNSFFQMQKGETTTTMGKKVSNSEIMFKSLPVRRDGKIEPDYVEANWIQLKKMIRKKFNRDYTTRNVLTARMRWYQQHQNMVGVSKMYFAQLEKWPPVDVDLETNEFAWHTFLYVNDKKLLKKASEWMAKLIQQKPGRHELLDTYASLLYKQGLIDDAIKWEEKALSVTNPTNEKQKTIYRDVIQKIKKGEPTYLDEGAIWAKE